MGRRYLAKTWSPAAVPVALLVLTVAAAALTVPSETILPLRRHDCGGVFSECSVEAEEAESAEWLMESLTTGRLLLQNGGNIGYGALNQNRPVFSNAGSGRPYGRGCLAIYGCRQY